MKYYNILWVLLTFLTVVKSMGQSCCPTFKEYTNTNSLPDWTSVTQYIKAGSLAAGPGPVKVMSGQNKNFIAGQSVTLEPGFETMPASVFSARIGPCESAPVSVTPVSVLKPCNHELLAMICNPAGHPVEITWSTGATNVASIHVAPSTTTSYWVKVKNLTDGKEVQKHYFVTPDYFDQMPYVYYQWNSFEPDGDGVHDIWYNLFDSNPSNDGVKQKAFNAYKFELTIWNRWGTIVSATSGERASPGFSEDDIFWNGKLSNVGGMMPVGQYYYIKKLWSCVGYKEYEGDIYLAPDILRTDASVFEPEGGDLVNRNMGADVYPNPASDFLNISLPRGRFDVQLISLVGTEVYSAQDVSDYLTIDVGALNGFYLLKMVDEFGNENVNRVHIN